MKLISRRGIRLLTVFYISFIVYGSLFPFQMAPHPPDLVAALKNLFASIYSRPLQPFIGLILAAYAVLNGRLLQASLQAPAQAF